MKIEFLWSDVYAIIAIIAEKHLPSHPNPSHLYPNPRRLNLSALLVYFKRGLQAAKHEKLN